MVEIEGERTLAASCIREPAEGMVVTTNNARAENARKMVMELLVADQPKREEARDKSSHLWDMAELNGVSESRFPKLEKDRIPLLDDSHVAMKRQSGRLHFNCNLCVRACRDVQVNDVIGMAGRGHDLAKSGVRSSNGPDGDSRLLRSLWRMCSGLPDRCLDAGHRAGRSATGW